MRRPTLRQVATGIALAEVGLLLGMLVYLAAADRALVVRLVSREEMMRSRSPAGLVIPVAGVRAADLRDTYGDPRSGGRGHQGMDIFAARGTPVLAAAAGTVVRRDTAGAGGIALYLRGLDARTVYYYAHLDRVRPGLKEGDLVRAGDAIGSVGQTGNVSRPHLHFSVFTVTDPNTVRRARDLNPYPLLRPKSPDAAPR